MRSSQFHSISACVLGLVIAFAANSQPSQKDAPTNEPAIQWYATLDRGLAEAKRTAKPILFVSAAPHCSGVSGMW